MQNKFTALFAVFLSFALFACARPGAEVSGASLAGLNFELRSVDGTPYSLKAKPPAIFFDASMRVSGFVCNQFFGQGRLEGGKLTVSNLASTRRLCFEQKLSEYEFLISAMLTAGVELEYADGLLTMRRGEHSLVYKMTGGNP